MTRVHESILAIYFASILLREVFQSMLSNTKEYFWRSCEVVSVIGFIGGLTMRYTGANSSGFPGGGGGEGVFLGDASAGEAVGSPATPWKLLYGLSLCASILRGLEVISVFSARTGLLVVVIRRIMPTVVRWVVVFGFFVFAFSTLLFGAGDPRGILNKCDVALEEDVVPAASASGEAEHYMFAACLGGWWLVRTVRCCLCFARLRVLLVSDALPICLASFTAVWKPSLTSSTSQIFQGFGELFLDEMTNEWSVAIVILTFIFLNVVLLNLLIAMMSGTYTQVSQQANRQKMLEQYSQIKEHSRPALAAPPFVNIPWIVWALIHFAFKYRSMRDRHVDCGFWKLLDIYLSRNSDDVLAAKHVPATTEDLRDRLRLQSFMERIKQTYLDRLHSDSQHELQRIQRKIDHLTINLDLAKDVGNVRARGHKELN